MVYRKAIDRYSKLVQAELSKMEAIYNFDIGDEFEIACCQIIQALLPYKYGICRGHLITKDDQQAGDDLIIFDQQYAPTLRLLPKGDFSRKEFVPVESVYAYIEVKHKLVLEGENENFAKALSQVEKVKALPRKKRSHNEVIRGFDLEGFPLEVMDFLDPECANPMYGVILSRHIEQTSDIREKLKTTNAEEKLSPDLIIAGSQYIGLPMQKKDNNIASFRVFRHISNCFSIREVSNNALAIGLLSLLNALECIDLGAINWRTAIINQLNCGMKTDNL